MCDGPVSTTLDNCFTPSPGCFGSYHATTTKMCFLLKRPQRCIFLDFHLFLSPHSPSWLLSPHISHEESGRKSWVTRLCSRPFTFLYLSVAHSTYLSQALGFFHFLPLVHGFSSVVLHVSTLHIVSLFVSNVVRAERDDLLEEGMWLHAVIEYYFNSSALLLYLSPSCYF